MPDHPLWHGFHGGVVADALDLEAAFTTGFAREDFEAAVERIREYIRAGDCMQVVLSQRLSLPFDGEGLDV